MCQEKINTAFGAGFPELINVGMLYQHNQTQYGISIGGFYYSGDFLGQYFATSVSGDFYYHFSGHSEFSKRRPWFFRTGITFFNASPLDKHLFLNCRLGRDFNESEKSGVSITIGFITRLHYFNKSEFESVDGNKMFLFPSAGISLFYRIGPKKNN